MTPRPLLGAGWVVGAVGAILVATLAPATDWAGARLHFFSLVPSGVNAWLNVIVNVVLYLPLGLALSARRSPRWRVSVIGGVLSTVTELLQFLVPGRDPSASDIIANTIGASVGSVVFATPLGRSIQRVLGTIEQSTLHLLHPQRQLASVCSLAWALIVTAVLTVTALLLSPAPPTSQSYFVRSPLFDRIPGPVRIGGGGDDGGFFSGVIDDVRIYDRPRSAQSIQLDMVQQVTATMSPPAGLVAAYGFDAPGGSIAHDDAGHGHDGEIEGASWVDRGRFGGALSFNGHSSEVLIPETLELGLRDGMTLEAWVFPIGDPARWPAVVAHESYFLYGSSEAGRYLAAAGGLLGSSNERTRLVEPIPVGEWTHLAGTYDGQTIRLYVNGKLGASTRWWSPHQPALVSVNGLSLPFGAVVDQRRMRPLLTSDVALHATVTCGAPEATAAPVFFVMAPGDVNVISLLAEGADLLLRSSTWARRLGLLSPDYRVPGAFSNCSPGQPLEVTLSGRLQNPRADLNGREIPVAGPGLGSGWAFLIHSELLPVWLQLSCTLAWLGLLSFPFGFWMRRGRLTAVGAATLAVAFQVTPHLWHIQPLNLIHIAAVCAGVLLGATCQAFVRRRAAF